MYPFKTIFGLKHFRVEYYITNWCDKNHNGVTKTNLEITRRDLNLLKFIKTVKIRIISY
jgi:hypothetical protein